MTAVGTCGVEIIVADRPGNDMRGGDRGVAVNGAHTDAAEGAAVAIRSDNRAAKALIANGSWNSSVGDERFLERLAALGFFDQVQAILERSLVGPVRGHRGR